MKRFLAGEIDPLVFHMSWTKNKENKRLYFEQVSAVDGCLDDKACVWFRCSGCCCYSCWGVILLSW